MVLLKNTVQNARYLRSIFANEDNERRIKHVLKVNYI